MRTTLFSLSVVAALGFVLAGCSTEPKTPEGKANLHDDAVTALNRFDRADPSLKDLMNRSYGYAVFPTIGKGGAIVGGAYGRGEVYEQGRLVGYADVAQGSIGLQLGGESFSELIIFESKDALDRFKSGNFNLGANASAVAATAGAAGAVRFENGIAVFITKPAGLMGELSVSGQKFSFRPMESTTNRPTGTYSNQPMEVP